MRLNPFEDALRIKPLQRRETAEEQTLKRQLSGKTQTGYAQSKKDYSDLRSFMAELDRGFGKRPNWQSERKVVRDGLLADLRGKDGVSTYPLLARPKPGQSTDEFYAELYDGYRLPGAERALAKARAAIASGNLSQYASKHQSLIEGRATLKAQEAAARQAELDAMEEERFRRGVAELPFDIADYQFSKRNSDAVRLKPGMLSSAYPGGAMPLEAADRLMRSIGIDPGQFSATAEGEGMVRGLRPTEKPESAASPTMQGLDAVAQESIGDAIGIFTDPNATIDQTINGLVQIITSIPALEPFKLLAAGAKGAKSLKAALGTERGLAEFSSALDNLGLPKDLSKKVAAMSDEQFESLRDGMIRQMREKGIDIGYGTAGLDEGAEFAAKQVGTPGVAPPVEAPRVTGLSNQVQGREAAQGFIDDISPSKGTSLDDIHAKGKELIDSDPVKYDPDSLARRIAEGGEDVSAEKFGVLLEGKRRKLLEIDAINAQLDADPGNKKLLELLEEKRSALQDYLNDVQVGKGKWSDAGRALQIGTSLDEGNFEDVLQALRRGGHATDAETRAAQEASGRVKDIDVSLSEVEGASKIAQGRKPKWTSVTDAPVPSELRQAQSQYDAALNRAEKSVKDDYKRWWTVNLKKAGEGDAEYDKWWQSALKGQQKEFDAIQKAIKKDAEAGYVAWWKNNQKFFSGAEKAYDKWWNDQIKALQKEFDKAVKIEDAAVRKEQVQLLSAQADSLDLQRQLAEGSFTPPKIAPAVSQAVENIRAERDMWAKRVRQAVKDASVPKAEKAAREVAGTVRGLSLGTDIGVLFRQGLFSVSRPKAFAKGVIEGAKNVFSEANLAQYQRRLDTEKWGDGSLKSAVRKKHGLDVTDTVNNREELVTSRLMQKIPWIGKAVGGSLERFQTTFINTVRAETFDAAVKRGYNADELRLRAQFINNATGRGNFDKAPGLLKEILLTSPRYEKSRWAMLGEPLKNLANVGRKGSGTVGVNRAALANIQDMAVTATEVYGLFKAAELAGYEVDFDPTSSDFLKMRKGDEVWDVTAGIAPRLRDVMRFVSAFSDDEWASKMLRTAGSAIARPASPIVRHAVEKGSYYGQKASGVEEPVNLLSGFKFEEGDVDYQTFAPLVVQAIKEAYEKDGPASAVGAGAKEFLGTSVSRYPKPGKSGGKTKPFREMTTAERGAHIKKKQDEIRSRRETRQGIGVEWRPR